MAETEKNVEATIGRCPDSHWLVGFVQGIVGAHSQGETEDELKENIAEVMAMIDTPEFGIDKCEDEGLDVGELVDVRKVTVTYTCKAAA